MLPEVRAQYSCFHDTFARTGKAVVIDPKMPCP
jgi:hypothetical protein